MLLFLKIIIIIFILTVGAGTIRYFIESDSTLLKKLKTQRKNQINISIQNLNKTGMGEEEIREATAIRISLTLFIIAFIDICSSLIIMHFFPILIPAVKIGLIYKVIRYIIYVPIKIKCIKSGTYSPTLYRFDNILSNSVFIGVNVFCLKLLGL